MFGRVGVGPKENRKQKSLLFIVSLAFYLLVMSDVLLLVFFLYHVWGYYRVDKISFTSTIT